MVVVCGSGDGIWVVGVRMRKSGAVVVTKTEKIQFRQCGSDVRAGPAVRSLDVR